jgi:hypothetical protein
MANNANWRNSKLIVGLVLAKLVHSVRAETASGAVVWWFLFTMCALAASTAYLLYLQFVQKKPLGKHHPNYDGEGSAAEEETKHRVPNSSFSSKDGKDKKNPNERVNKEPVFQNNIKKDMMKKGAARPEDVRYSHFYYR